MAGMRPTWARTTTTSVTGGEEVVVHAAGADGPLVLLLHGGGLDHRLWDGVAGRVAGDVRVVAPDLRSHGASSTARVPYRHCDDVVRVLEDLAAPAHVVGLSMGGAAALEAAVLRPDLVASVVSVGAGATDVTFGDPWTVERRARLDVLAAAGDAAAWVDLWVDTFLVGPGRTADALDPAAVDLFRAMVTANVATHVVAGAVPPHALDDGWARLAELTVPVVGAVGELDLPDHHAFIRRAVEAVPAAELAVLPGVGHHAPLEDPDGFATFLGEHLRRVATAGGRA